MFLEDETILSIFFFINSTEFIEFIFKIISFDLSNNTLLTFFNKNIPAIYIDGFASIFILIFKIKNVYSMYQCKIL